MKLGETANVEFVMENLTGIETDWSLKLDNFMVSVCCQLRFCSNFSFQII